MRTGMGIKIVSLILLAAAAMSACSRGKSYYICTCSARASGGHDSVYTFGEIPQSDAYAQCKVYNDSLDTCLMTVIK